MSIAKTFKKLLKWFKNLSNPKKVLTIIVGYICSMYIYSLMNWMYWNTKSYILEGFGTPSKFIFFHMNGCPHCENMMDDWDNFSSSNTTSIKTEKIEKKENPELIKKYDIKGFPSLLLIDENGEKIKEYNGDRTADDFQNFVNNL